MSKKLKWIAGISLIILLAIIWIVLRSRNSKGTLLLTTEPVRMGTIATTVTATGTVQPVDTIAVGSQVSGIIRYVYADFNQVVKKGQLMAQLDKTILEAQVQQINANLAAAIANNTYQESNYNRQSKLYQAGAISKAEMETALYQYKNAAANIEAIRAQLVSAKQNLAFADIYAPADGTVMSRSVSEGQTVAASLNAPTLFTLAKDLHKMQVNAAIDEADIANVKAGQKVIFSVDAYPNDTFSGTVKEIRLNTSVSANVVTYTTIIEAPNENLKLKPGMTASIIVYTSVVDNILIVPSAALKFEPDAAIISHYSISRKKTEDPSVIIPDEKLLPGNIPHVWIKTDSLHIVRRDVTTGTEDETQTEIQSGLKKGEQVVTGYQLLQKKEKDGVAKSPFLPSRPAGGRQNQGPPQ